MSNTDASRSFLDGAPFATFNTPGDTRSGIDQFFGSPAPLQFSCRRPYSLTDADVPERIRRMDPGYLATILDRAVPVFIRLISKPAQTGNPPPRYPLVPHTRTFMTLLAALVHLVLAVRELIPTRARDEWFAFLPEGESAHSAHWDMGRVYDDTDIDRVVQLFDDAIAPENAIFASLLIPAWFSIPRGPHEDSLEEPIPCTGYVRLRLRVALVEKDPGRIYAASSEFSPSASPVLQVRVRKTYSPHYEPSTPPERSLTPILRPATPPAQLGPSAVGSASFDIRQLLGSAKKDPPTPRKASAIAASPPSPSEMQQSRKRWISRPARGPLVLPLEASKLLAGAPSAQPAPASLRDKKGRPMIKIKSSQKSVRRPSESEDEGRGEEEEEEEAPPRPAKRRRTAPALPKSKTPGKSKGKGKAQVETPALPDLSTTFPIPQEGRAASLRPPQPVPSMDTVSLAETLASHVANLWCSTRDVPIASSATANATTVPRALCEHCEKGRLSHCSHNFSVADHARAANHLEPYTRLANELAICLLTTFLRCNELITDLSAARANYGSLESSSSAPARVSPSK
ncbi:hypothetical protein B0H14DRAFT_2655244 [Mycena olivaceomarginata]|nr:hypothetical protein B0H14DRAFT_2655244 [Mycena olivaceomarginata]